MLSGILDQPKLFSFSPDGDPVYPISLHLHVGFKGATLSEQEIAFNRSMSAVSISVGWGLNC